MPRRIDLGRAVLLAGSALLLVSLFLSWYDPDATAWEVFEALDLVLAALAVAGIAAALRPDLVPPWAAAAVPAAALLIVFVQMVNHPPAAQGADLASGIWIALAGALLMAAGAALSLAAISVTVHVRDRDVRRRVAAVDRRHAGDDDAVAEDLDADAGAGSGPTRGASLFGGLGSRPEPVADAEAPPARTDRFAPRDPVEGGAVAAGSEPAELEPTEPMTSLPDAGEEDAERP